MAEDQKKSSGVKHGVLSLAIKEKAALYSAYMPYVSGGGLFIPTNRQFKPGEEVFMLLSLVDESTKFKVVGKVVWVSPTQHSSRPRGVGVQFSEKDGGIEVKNKIESILGGALKSTRVTHTM